MKNCSSLAALSIIPASFYLISRNIGDASIIQGNAITAPQLAVAILVGVLYTANHFKSRIKTFFNDLFSKTKSGEGREG